jgi:thiol:disulfide interchange protein DsbC
MVTRMLHHFIQRQSNSLLCALFFLSVTSTWALGQEAQIKKTIMERIPEFPKILEVSKAPMNGLYEIRVEDDEIYYTDAEANFLVQGSLIDTRTRQNITDERIEKLTQVDFNTLPMKDSITIVHGNGKRHLAIFEDPNCGYCKRFEKDLLKVDNVTVHLFLYPVLGQDSIDKSKVLWCAKDKAKAWGEWMKSAVMPTNTANCDTNALNRNVEFGHKHKINGTPTLIVSSGARVPGAINASQIEQLLTSGKF